MPSFWTGSPGADDGPAELLSIFEGRERSLRVAAQELGADEFQSAEKFAAYVRRGVVGNVTPDDEAYIVGNLEAIWQEGHRAAREADEWAVAHAQQWAVGHPQHEQLVGDARARLREHERVLAGHMVAVAVAARGRSGGPAGWVRPRARRGHAPRGRTARRQRSTTCGRDDGDSGPGDGPGAGRAARRQRSTSAGRDDGDGGPGEPSPAGRTAAGLTGGAW